jgi:UDP-N-acetylglucosamine 4,6-dehydratase
MDGGEIFVPKIPSMHVVALAKAIAPDLPHTIVGIRPGEKVHETLVTQDDARSTADLGDRFVILPSIRFWRNDVFDKFERVASDFTYTSNNNPMTLDVADLLALLSESDQGVGTGVDTPTRS